MKTEIRLARAIKKLPAFRVFDWKIDTEFLQQPTLRPGADEYLAIISRGQGQEVDGAFDYAYEERYLVQEMHDWAEKHGFKWECIVNDGLYGLVEA